MDSKKIIIVLAVLGVAFFIFQKKKEKPLKNLLNNEKEQPFLDNFKDKDVFIGDIELSKQGIHIYQINWKKGKFCFMATFGDTCIQGEFDKDENVRFFKNFQDSTGFIFTCKREVSRIGNELVHFVIKNPALEYSFAKCVNLTSQKIS